MPATPDFPSPTIPIAMFYWNGTNWARYTGGTEGIPTTLVAVLLDTTSTELRGLSHQNFTSNSIASGASATIYTPASGKRFYCLGFNVRVSAATAISIRRTATKFNSMEFAQADSKWINYPPPGIKGGVDELFKVYNDGSATVTIDVEIWGFETTVDIGST